MRWVLPGAARGGLLRAGVLNFAVGGGISALSWFGGGVVNLISVPQAIIGTLMLAVWLVTKDKQLTPAFTVQANYISNGSFLPPGIFLASGNSYCSDPNCVTCGRGRRLEPPAVVERAEVVTGWRAYSVMPMIDADEVLVGAWESWESASKTACCQTSVGHSPAPGLKAMLNDDVVYRLWVQRGYGGASQRCVEHLSAGTCTCGVYGRANRGDLPPGQVYAEVEAYGVVALDDDGNWRASEVRIKRLYCDDTALGSRLAKRYGVEVFNTSLTAGR